MRLSRESVRTNLQKDLKFHPYKMCVVQELRATDYEQREDFAIRMQVQLEENENAVTIIKSDKAHFHLSGEVNKQILHYWASENPLNIHEEPLHSERVTVCAIGIFGIIGPYFCKDENGATVTVDAERYIHMLNTFLRPQMKRQRLHNVQNVYFQQDGATPHTARLSMDVVRRMFPGRVISLLTTSCGPQGPLI